MIPSQFRSISCHLQSHWWFLLTPHQPWSRSKYALRHSRNLMTPYFESNDQGLIWIYTYPVTSCTSSVLRLSFASPATWKGHPGQGRILPLKGDMSPPLDQIQEKASDAARLKKRTARSLVMRQVCTGLGCDRWILFHHEKVQHSSKRVCLHVVLREKASRPTCSYIDWDVWYIYCMKSSQPLRCSPSIRSNFFVDLTGLPNTVEEVSQAPGLSATKQTNETQALVTFGETCLGKSCHLRKYTLGVIGGFQMLHKVHDVRQWQVATSTQVHFACQVYFNLQHFLLLLFLKKRLFLDRKVRHKLVTGHFLFSLNTSCMTLPRLYCESDKLCRNINRMLQDHTRWHDIMIHGTLFQTSGTYIFQESGCSRPVFWPIPNLIWQESYHHFVSIPSWTDSHSPPQEQF